MKGQKLTNSLSLRNLSLLESCTPELLPPELRSWQLPRLDPSWTWVVEHDGDPIALIVTSYAHGLLMIWRLLSTSSARRSLNWLLAALPRILENARVRGCVAYATFLHDSRPEEAQLARIIQRSGGLLEPMVGTFAAGPLVPIPAEDRSECPSSPSSPPLPRLPE